MKIGIDARMYGKASRGIGRYIENLIKELEKLDSKNEYYIFLRQENFNEYKIKNKRFHKVLAPWRWYSWQEQIFFPLLLNKYDLDLVHFPHFNVPLFYRKRYVVTIHDLILWFDSQEGVTLLSPVLYKIKKFFYKLILKNLLRKSVHIIVPSQYTKNDILKINPDISNKISVIYEGFSLKDLDCPFNDKDFKIRYNITENFYFYIGAAYPHKQLDFLIKSWKELNIKESLFFIGKKDDFYKRLEELVKKMNLENKIHFLGFISDEELPCFYRKAKAFVYPSRYEGFGLPPLEALANHCPVLVSYKTCLPEILEDKVIYFNYSIESFHQALENLKIKKWNWNEIDRWLNEKYTWKKMASKILNIYES